MKFSLKYLKHFFRKHLVFIILGVLAGYYFILVWISPAVYFAELRKEVAADTTFTQTYKEVYDHPDLSDLVRQKAYVSASLELASKDSIQLLINLKDSTIQLSIHGVSIHQAKITEFKLDPLLRKLSNREYLYLFTHPITVRKQKSTIVKEPIVVREAPKDPLQASENAFIPDTLIQGPAFFKLETIPSLKFTFRPDSPVSSKESRIGKHFWRQDRRAEKLKRYAHLFTFRKIDYTPKVALTVDSSELRAIYRALPDQAFMVFNF